MEDLAMHGGNQSGQTSIAGKLVLIGLCAILLPACAGRNGATIYQDPSAIAVLYSTQGGPVHGVVTFVRSGREVLVNANLSGFKPNSAHVLRIQQIGDCTEQVASSAGDHFDQASLKRGGANVPMQPGSVLGDVTADSKGEVYVSFKVSEGAFGTGSDSLIGRSVVVHAEKDDPKSQPDASAGAPLACGLITRNPDRRTRPMADKS
jgi:Cu-Zn family superoxide dismutase